MSDPTLDTLRTLYPTDADESTATVRARIILDDSMGTSFEDLMGDGLCMVVLPLTMDYNITAHHDADEEMAETIRGMRHAFDAETLARWVRICYGVPAIVKSTGDYWAVVYLDPSQLEATGAEATVETLESEWQEFTRYRDGEVYGVALDYLQEVTYTVGDSTSEEREGGNLQESRLFTTTDLDAAELMAARWGTHVSTTPAEWVDSYETVWGILGMDSAESEARATVDNTKREALR